MSHGKASRFERAGGFHRSSSGFLCAGEAFSDALSDSLKAIDRLLEASCNCRWREECGAVVHADGARDEAVKAFGLREEIAELLAGELMGRSDEAVDERLLLVAYGSGWLSEQGTSLRLSCLEERVELSASGLFMLGDFEHDIRAIEEMEVAS